MPSIISFDSGTPGQELAGKVSEKFDYSQIDGALKNHHGVAENVFARCAKHHFADAATKGLLGGTVRLVYPDQCKVEPLWVAQMSVTLSLDKMRVEDKLDTSKLERLTEGLISAIACLREDRPLVLVDSLSTKITEVAPGVFTFSLKQKWGLDAQ